MPPPTITQDAISAQLDAISGTLPVVGTATGAELSISSESSGTASGYVYSIDDAILGTETAQWDPGWPTPSMPTSGGIMQIHNTTASIGSLQGLNIQRQPVLHNVVYVPLIDPAHPGTVVAVDMASDFLHTRDPFLVICHQAVLAHAYLTEKKIQAEYMESTLSACTANIFGRSVKQKTEEDLRQCQIEIRKQEKLIEEARMKMDELIGPA